MYLYVCSCTYSINLYVCSCIYNPLFVCVFCIALVWKNGFAEYWSLNKNQSINQSINQGGQVTKPIIVVKVPCKLLYVIQVKEFLIKCSTSWPYLISEFLVAYITIVASDWPRTFFTPKVFLFSILLTTTSVQVDKANLLVATHLTFPKHAGRIKMTQKICKDMYI